MTPEEKLRNGIAWHFEFRKDYKSWMTGDELVQKYSWVISYEELIEYYVGLYIANQKLKDKLEKIHKVLDE